MEKKDPESYFIQVVPVEHDAQFIPDRQWSMEEVCIIFGVPAGLLQTVETEQSYRLACESSGQWMQRLNADERGAANCG